jgi:uncharacterized membrane protein
LRLFFSWFDRWIVKYFLTLKILYIYWNVRMNEGKRWKLLVDATGCQCRPQRRSSASKSTPSS